MLKSKWFIVFMMLLLLSTCSPKDQTTGEAKDFTLTSLDGTDYTLSSLKGKVVLIDFWATWCPPCRSSIPVFINLYNKYNEKGFIVLGISREERTVLKGFQDANMIPYPILLDNKNIAQEYGVTAIPTIFIIDKKGKVRKTQLGFSPEAEAIFDTLIDSLLTE